MPQPQPLPQEFALPLPFCRFERPGVATSESTRSRHSFSAAFTPTGHSVAPSGARYHRAGTLGGDGAAGGSGHKGGGEVVMAVVVVVVETVEFEVMFKATPGTELPSASSSQSSGSMRA